MYVRMYIAGAYNVGMYVRMYIYTYVRTYISTYRHSICELEYIYVHSSGAVMHELSV